MPSTDQHQAVELPANQKSQALYRHRLKLLANQMSAETVPGAATELTKELEKVRRKKIVFSSDDSIASSKIKVKNKLKTIEMKKVKRDKLLFSSDDSSCSTNSTRNKAPKVAQRRVPPKNVNVSKDLKFVDEVAIVKDVSSNVRGTDTIDGSKEHSTNNNGAGYLLKKVASNIRPTNIPVPTTNETSITGSDQNVTNTTNEYKDAHQQCNNRKNDAPANTSNPAADKKDDTVDVCRTEASQNDNVETVGDALVTILPDTPTVRNVDNPKTNNSTNTGEQVIATNAVVNSEHKEKSSEMENEPMPMVVEPVGNVPQVVKTLSSVIHKIVPSLSFGGNKVNATFDEESDSGIHDHKSVEFDVCSSHSNKNEVNKSIQKHQESDDIRFENRQEENATEKVPISEDLNVVEDDIPFENQFFVINGIVPGYDRDQMLTTKASFVSDSGFTRMEDESERSNQTTRSWLRYATKSPLRSRDDAQPCLTTQYIARFEARTDTDTDNDAVEIERVYENNSQPNVNRLDKVLKNRLYKPFVTKFAGAKDSNIETALMGRNDPIPNDSTQKGTHKPVDVSSWMLNKSLDTSDHTSRTNNKAISPDRKIKIGLMEPTRTDMPQRKRVAFLTQLRQLSKRYVNDTDTVDDQASLATDLFSQTDGGESYITSMDNRTILSEPPYLDEEDGTNVMNVIVNNLLQWSDSFECKDLVNTLECTDFVSTLGMAKIEGFNDYESFDGSEYSGQYTEYCDSISPTSIADRRNGVISSVRQQKKRLPVAATTSTVKDRVGNVKQKLIAQETNTKKNLKINNSKKTTSFLSIESESVVSYIDEEDETVRTKSAGAGASTVGLRERVEQFVTNATDELIDSLSTWDIDDIENDVYDDSDVKDVDTSNETDENNISFDSTQVSAESETPSELKRQASIYIV
jgi:hypothetical protein